MVATLAAATFLAGCGDSDDQYVKVCTDQAGNRVDEDHCDDDTSTRWVYIPPGMSYPAYGHPVTGYVERPPAGARVTGARSGAGVAPARGGFGGRAGTTSGG